ncbi:MAG: LapA family protein [Mangrovicoccus sp.]|nr:LapA family protein [Mangrovicoccus sp.]
MRLIKFLISVVIAIALVTLCFANRTPVTLTLLPEDFATALKYNFEITLPLYAVVLAGIGIGLLLGFVWEWLREGKHRSAAVKERREKAVLAAENKKLKADKNTDKDEVLVLLDEAAGAR